MGSSWGSSVIPLQRRVRLAFSTPIEAATTSSRDSAVISSGKEDTKISAPTMLCPITLGKSKPQLSGFNQGKQLGLLRLSFRDLVVTCWKAETRWNRDETRMNDDEIVYIYDICGCNTLHVTWYPVISQVVPNTGRRSHMFFANWSSQIDDSRAIRCPWELISRTDPFATNHVAILPETIVVAPPICRGRWERHQNEAGISLACRMPM